jgi:hypothetical protein
MPVDEVFRRVRASVPGVRVERLSVKFPADDDNVWWVWTGAERRLDAVRSVQIDSASDGAPPFLIEGDGDGERLETKDAAVAVAAILRWL